MKRITIRNFSETLSAHIEGWGLIHKINCSIWFYGQWAGERHGKESPNPLQRNGVNQVFTRLSAIQKITPQSYQGVVAFYSQK